VLTVALAAPQSLELPPGVDPACRGLYPNCPPQVAQPLLPVAPSAPAVLPRVAPAGVDLARCPGYPHACDNAAAHNPAGQQGIFPPGVDRTKCPAYPFQLCI